MEPAFLQIFFVGVIVALVGVALYFTHLKEKARRKELAVVARRLGWRFDPGKDPHHDDEYRQFKIFRRGHGRAAFNPMYGAIAVFDRPCPVKMGDFTYKISSGKSTRVYHFSYLILHPAVHGLPNLLVRREGWFDKLAEAIGFEDIDFESAEFSRRFLVKSSDKRVAYDVVHPRMMEFLMAGEGPAINIQDGYCCMSDGRNRWEPRQFEEAVEWAGTFFELWPEHVVQQLGG